MSGLLASQLAGDVAPFVRAECGRDPTLDQVVAVAVEVLATVLVEHHFGHGGGRVAGAIVARVFDEVEPDVLRRWGEYRRRLSEGPI